jgi:hypothetical protein
VGASLAERKNTSEISTSIFETKSNWVDALMLTVVRAGIDQPAEEVAETTK